MKRVIAARLSLTDETLLLLYSEPGVMSDKSLAKYLEQDRLDKYGRVLDLLHKAREIEWNKATGTVTLSPVGREDVEDRLLRARSEPQGRLAFDVGKLVQRGGAVSDPGPGVSLNFPGP